MKYKVLLVTAGILVVGAALTGGLVFGLKAYKKNKEESQQSAINKDAAKVSANYDSKSEIESIKIDPTKIKFGDVDLEKYEVIIKNFTANEEDNTKLKLTFYLKNKKDKSISKDYEITIEGFKKGLDNKQQLNLLAQKVTIGKYYGNTSNILATDVKKENIMFENVLDGYLPVIKSTAVKLDDQTVVVVTFTIKQRDGEIESDTRNLELGGFKKPTSEKVPKTQQELNEIVNKIEAITYQGEKSAIPVESIDKNNIIIPGLSEDIELTITSITPSNADNTKAVITFKISEKGGTISSSSKSLTLDGFRKPFLKVDKLTEEINKITEATYEGITDKKDTKVSDITSSMIKFPSLPKNFESQIIQIKSKDSDESVANITFKIKEVDGTIYSNPKTIEISGFKKSKSTEDDLDKELDKVTSLEFLGEKSETEVKNIKKEEIKFIGLTSKFKTTIVSITEKENDITTAVIKFKIYEADITVSSKEKTLEITGFKKVFKTQEELDKMLEGLNAITVDNKEVSSATFSEIDKTKIKLKGLSEEYIVEIVSFEKDPKDDSKAIFKFKIKEKDGTITSKEKSLEITGFKKAAKTKEELDKVLEGLNTITVDNKEISDVTFSDIDKTKIKLKGLSEEYVVEIVSFEKDAKEDTKAILKFKIKEKNGTITSKEKSLEITGFKKVAKTQAELNEVVDSLTEITIGDKKISEVLLSEVKNSDIKLKNLSAEYEVEIVSFTKNDKDDTKATLKFMIKEKSGTIKSKEKTLEITGFKKTDKTKEELDKELQKVISLDYSGKKDEIEVKKIKNENIKFTGLTSEFKATIVSITENESDKTKAVVKFKISEVGKTTFSKEKTLEISGFKKPAKTQAELDRVSETLKEITVGGKDVSKVSFSEISKTNIKFKNLGDEYVAEIVSLMENKEDKSKATLKFKIKEKNGSISSTEKTLEISGLMVKTFLTKKELDDIVDLIVDVSYDNDNPESKKSTKVKDINRSLLKPVGIDTVGKNIEHSIVSVTEKPGDATTAIVILTINEVGGSIKSKEYRTEVTDFKA